MSVFANSVKRLYKAGKIKSDYIEELLTNGKINEEEKDYILNV